MDRQRIPCSFNYSYCGVFDNGIELQAKSCGINNLLIYYDRQYDIFFILEKY
jgi:hypothetical protein